MMPSDHSSPVREVSPDDAARLRANLFETPGTVDSAQTQYSNSGESPVFTPATSNFVGASDIANGGSSARSFQTAANHFNRFVRWISAQQGAESVANSLANGTYQSLDKSKIDYNVLDYFGTYLMQSVPCYETASRYLSAIFNDAKNQLEKSGVTPPAFTTTRIRKGLIKFFADKAAATQSNLSTPTEELSKDDLTAITVLCILFADQNDELCIFVFLVCSLVQFAGRVQESSLVRLSNLELHSVAEWVSASDAEKVFGVKFWRMKTTTEPSPLQIFSHRDNFLMDWVFLCGYSLVCRRSAWGGDPDHLFPGFFEKAEKDAEASRDHTGKRPTGKTSEFWKKVFERVHTLGDGLEEDEMERLLQLGIKAVRPSKSATSHGGKKYSVRLANEHPMVKTTWICFRAGWRMKMVHTIFDYLNANPHNDRQVGRQLSGWSILDSTGSIGGGRPPILESISESTDESVPNKELVSRFCATLFCPYETLWEENEGRLEQFRLITASLLRYFRDFVDLVGVKFAPAEAYGGLPNHPLLQKMWAAAVGCGIPEGKVVETLQSWSKVVSDDFVCRNISFASESDVEKLGSGFRVDPRSLLSTIREQHGTMQLLARDNHDLKEALKELKRTHRELIASNSRLEHKVDLLINRLSEAESPATLMGNPENAPLDAAVCTDVRSTPIVKFPSSTRGLKMPNAMVDFYLSGWYNLYQPGWRPLSGESPPNKNSKKTIRAVVEFASLFLETPIPQLPEDAINSSSPEASEWRRQVKKACTDAWSRAIQFLYENNMSPTDSCSSFERNMKDIDPELWPAGPEGNSDYFCALRACTQLKEDLIKHRGRKRRREISEV